MTSRLFARSYKFTIPPVTIPLVASSISSPFLFGYPFAETSGFGSRFSAPSAAPTVPNELTVTSTFADLAGSTNNTTPFVVAYPISNSGIGTKYSAPASVFVANCIGSQFHSTTDLGLAASTTPFLAAYPWTTGTGYGSKYANAGTLPTSAASGFAFSASGQSCATQQTSAPSQYACAFTPGSGFGSKYSNPVTAPVSTSTFGRLNFSSAGFLCFSNNTTTPFVDCYPFTDGTGYGTHVTAPGSASDGNFDIDWTADGGALSFKAIDTPWIIAYPFTTGFGTAYSSPSVNVGSGSGDNGGVAFTNDHTVIAIASTALAIGSSALSWSNGSGFGTAFTAPGSGTGQSFKNTFGG